MFGFLGSCRDVRWFSAVNAVLLIVLIAAPLITAQKKHGSKGQDIEKLDLRILYVGELNTPRSKAFIEFFKKQAKDVKSAALDGSAVKIARDADVVVLDWAQGGEAAEMRPIGDRLTWTKPTVLIGSSGLNLSIGWHLRGGFG